MQVQRKGGVGVGIAPRPDRALVPSPRLAAVLMICGALRRLLRSPSWTYPVQIGLSQQLDQLSGGRPQLAAVGFFLLVTLRVVEEILKDQAEGLSSPLVGAFSLTVVSCQRE